jgi:hypothetical protein
VTFIKIPYIDEERLDDELILLHPETLQVKLLNETATVLWDALDVYPTVEGLAALLTEARPEISATDAAAYIATFLDELRLAGLIEARAPIAG